MAPARRRGASKAKANGHLNVGDLVLAKVKGFPAWPAKISRPEDWEKTPDPKKYFVQFFGTKEIAFVAPADIQGFTNEAKNKLSARCQGKTKYFSQAVKEICAASDELQNQNVSGLRDDTDDRFIDSEAPSVDVVVGDLKDATGNVVANEDKANNCVGNVSSKLESCLQRCLETDCQDEKTSVSGGPSDSSSLSPVSKSKMFNGAELKKNASISNFKDSLCPKGELSDCKDVGNANDSKQDDNGQRALTNRSKSKKLGTGSRRRSEGAGDRNKSGESSAGCADLSMSEEPLKGGKKGKNTFNIKSDSPDGLKSYSDVNSGKKDTKTSFKLKNKLPEVLVSSEEVDGKTSTKQKKIQLGHAKCNLGPNDTLHTTKKLKHMDAKDDTTLGSLPKDVKSVPPGSTVADDKTFKSELRRSSSCLKTKRSLMSRGQSQTNFVCSDDSVHGGLPGTKCHSQVEQAMSDSSRIVSDEKTERSSLRLKDERNNVMVKQLQRKRRAVCLFDDDDDDNEPRTPIHGGAAKPIKSPSYVSEAMKSNNAESENSDTAQVAIRNIRGLEDRHMKEPSSQLHNDSLSTRQPQKEERTEEVIPVPVPLSPDKSDSKQFPLKMAKLSSASPVKSPQSATVMKSNAEQYKSSKPMIKVSTNATQKKSDLGSSKGPNSKSSSQHQVTAHKKKAASSSEISKTTPKSFTRAVEAAAAAENLKEPDAFHVDSLEVGMEEKSNLYVGSRTPETAKTMKHLIAAAQAKRRQANSQCPPLGIHNVQGGSPSPSNVHPFLSVSSNFVQADAQEVNEHATLATPSANGHHSASRNQHDSEEIEERRVGSVQRAPGGSLSGGTEASVSRDAFEGMIETLSRTKESIGRATRLAIDCAKYGIANEVVELLIRKLENESSFHRKVDLFFLVDSITQCSHSQKGIAGASYIPIVQEALPRLLGAGAPPGAAARENRRQCLKVLRLWLERKIFPESVLRHYMDDIGVSNDDMTVSFSLRRPSRAERAVDDPIREMEGMLVDEYGSNATFQLPGFLSSRVFEEDEDDDLPSGSCKDKCDVSSVDPICTLGQSETSNVTPNDKRHCILEDVDGELEMEDVSGHLKDERPVLLDISSEVDLQLQGLNRNKDSASNISAEIPYISEGSPPLPLDSPPAPPPLPSSPPPPPPSSPSPPPPPPLMLQPPPPPFPISGPPPSPFPISGPPPSLDPQSSGPAQPSLPSHPLMPPQSSPQLGYQQAVTHDYGGTTSGNQLVQMAGNSFPGGHNNAIVKNEIYPQPSDSFTLAAGSSSQEPSSFNHSRRLEYGQNDVYPNTLVPQPNQQFQQGTPTFAQRHIHPAQPQNQSNEYSFPKPTVQQHPPHSFHPPYPLPSLPDGRRQYTADEQWRMSSSEFRTNNQPGIWRGRNPCPGPSFGQESFFRPPLERLPASNIGYQHAVPSSLPAAPPMSGHGATHMLPCRPDIPTLNCWRPT